MTVIDSLVHVTVDGRWFDTAYDASEARLLREMDKAGVEKAVLVALAGFISNDFVLDLAARYPDRLIPCLSIDPASYQDAESAGAAAQEEIINSGARLVKLHPRLGKYDPLDPHCIAVLEQFAEARNPPLIWLDSLFHYPGKAAKRPTPETVMELLEHFPDLIFVILHGGGAQLLETADVIRPYPNAYLDLSHTLPRYEGSSKDLDIRWLMNNFEKRMVFGSDFPENGIKEAFEAFERICEGIDEQRKYLVLKGNLKHLLMESGAWN